MAQVFQWFYKISLMLQDRNPSQSPGEENPDPNPETQQDNAGEPFESDTQRIMHRHLQNKNDVITDEDIAGIRIGMTPNFDAAAEQQVEDAEGNPELNADGELKDQKETITPWDAIEPDK
jgi:hypothetical protein